MSNVLFIKRTPIVTGLHFKIISAVFWGGIWAWHKALRYSNQVCKKIILMAKLITDPMTLIKATVHYSKWCIGNIHLSVLSNSSKLTRESTEDPEGLKWNNARCYVAVGLMVLAKLKIFNAENDLWYICLYSALRKALLFILGSSYEEETILWWIQGWFCAW